MNDDNSSQEGPLNLDEMNTDELLDEYRDRMEEYRNIKEYEEELKGKIESLGNELEEKESKVEAAIAELDPKGERVRTGIERFDYLLSGGIPFGSNIGLYGDLISGKKVLMNSYLSEGLKRGVPTVQILTDKTVEDRREVMKYVLPEYEDYEEDLVHYIDCYSKPQGQDIVGVQDAPNAIFLGEEIEERAWDVDKKEAYHNLFNQMVESFETVTDEIEEEGHEFYRASLDSFSPVIAYLNDDAFPVLESLTDRVEQDSSTALHGLDKGRHSKEDKERWRDVIDGEVEFKMEQLENYLRVKGLDDLVTKDWIEYNHSEEGMDIGSFDLTTIRTAPAE